MNMIVMGLLGALLMIGAISAAHALKRWTKAKRAHRRWRRGTDEIPIVFSKEARVPAGVRSSVGFQAEMDLSLPARANSGRSTPAMNLDLPRRSGDLAFRERPLNLEAGEGWAKPQAPALIDSATAQEWEDAVGGSLVRYHRADARTMRLLPGRMEVEKGDEEQGEIRFVDQPGGTVEVTFGRRSGEPFRHVQLRSPTVSREHARMVREKNAWLIQNLSETNPIRVNGTPLAGSERHTLSDMDRVEMGDVVFRYRNP